MNLLRVYLLILACTVSLASCSRKIQGELLEKPIIVDGLGKFYSIDGDFVSCSENAVMLSRPLNRIPRKYEIKVVIKEGKGQIQNVVVNPVEKKIEFKYIPDQSVVIGSGKYTYFDLYLQDLNGRTLEQVKNNKIFDYRINRKLEGLEFEDGKWTWLDVPGMKCRDGSATGIGFKSFANSKKLMVFLKGGGICFNEITCATNPKSYDEGNWNRNRVIDGSVLNSEEPTNPFKDWNVVYFPYCSGDLFSGNKTEDNRHGFSNIEKGLRHIIEYLKIDRGIEEVLVYGTSAGGLGVLLNFEQVYNMVNDKKVKFTVVDNAGAIFLDEIFPPCFYKKIDDAVHLNLPSDIADYSSKKYDVPIKHIYEYTSGKYPDIQFGFSSSQEDTIFRFFYGLGKNNCNQHTQIKINMVTAHKYRQSLLNLEREVLQNPNNNWKFFFSPGSKHVLDTQVEKGFSGWLRRLTEH